MKFSNLSIFASASLLSLSSASPLRAKHARFNPPGPISLPHCPGQLTGTVLTPTLTALVSQQNPSQNFGASDDLVMFTPNDLGTIINFDIPEDATNKTCTLYFSFPDLSQSGEPNYSFSGAGNFSFSDFYYSAEANVTYSTMPPVYRDLGTINLVPGQLYNLSSMPCPVGPISGATFTSDSTFLYRQSYSNSGCPFGLFTTYE